MGIFGVKAPAESRRRRRQASRKRPYYSTHRRGASGLGEPESDAPSTQSPDSKRFRVQLDFSPSAYDRLQKITSSAARAGIVVYSIDGRGLSTDAPDAATPVAADPGGRMIGTAAGERKASEDPLNSLAVDTGGRAFFNNNDISVGVTTGLKETATYYLIAWRPEGEQQKNQKARRVEVSVVGRPDLVVRFRRTVGQPAVEENAKNNSQPAAAPPKNPGQQINNTLVAPYPKTNLPVAISLNFLDTAQYGDTLATAIRITTTNLPLTMQDGAPTGFLDLGGGVFDDQGKPVNSFNKRLRIRAVGNANPATPPDFVFYDYVTTIRPGIYQVRIAAFDEKQNVSGSAYQWVQIPDLKGSGLALSSLIVGEKKAEPDSPVSDPTNDAGQKPNILRDLSLSIDHRFNRSSNMRFLTFVYNASMTTAGSNGKDGARTIAAGANPSTDADLAIQIQILRDNQPVVTTPIKAVQTEGVSDLQRIPYAADVLLDTLIPGAYVLQVTVIDRHAKRSASQRYSFQID